MKQVMAPEANSSNCPDTKLIKTNLNDFLDKEDNKLGKPSNLGQKLFPQDHVFGMRIEGNEWDAGKCLRGEGTQYDVREDDDLGKCSKIGSRNIPKPGDQNRAFGVSTIRYDIKKPERQSVADPNVKIILYRIMQMKQQQFNSCFLNSLAHLEWDRKILIYLDQKLKYMKYLLALDFNLRTMCLKLFSKDLKSFRELSSIKLAVIPSKNPSSKCAANDSKLTIILTLISRY